MYLLLLIFLLIIVVIRQSRVNSKINKAREEREKNKLVDPYPNIPSVLTEEGRKQLYEEDKKREERDRRERDEFDKRLNEFLNKLDKKIEESNKEKENIE